MAVRTTTPGRIAVSDFDSPQVADNFLAAIGFQSRPQGEDETENEWRTATPSRKRRSRGPRPVETAQRPQPVLYNYWDALRIERGILDPSTHPLYHQGHRPRVPVSNTGNKDDGGWEGWSPVAGGSGPASWGTAPALDNPKVGAGHEEDAGRSGRSGNGDVRNAIGLKHSLAKYDNTWEKYNWGDLDGRDHNEVFGDPSYLDKFILAWMDAIPEGIVASLRGTKGRVEHWRCDINTNTGFFMAPVEYPETLVDHSKIDKQLESRRLNVSHIYNWEVKHGLQTLDSQPLSSANFERVLAATKDRGMPFLVAVRGSAREERFPKTTNVSLSPFGQVPFYEQDKCNEVLGFAFLSPWQFGLAGSGSGSSRASARIHVFVHPDYRRKKIGYSLLDMLLTSTSNRFVSETAYDFVDNAASPIYKKPTDPTRERQYYRLYLSYFVKHKHPRMNGDAKLEEEQKESEEELAWVKKLLEEQFNFEEVARLEAAHRSAKCREGPVYWLDEVVFEHTCWYGLNDIKEDY
ncbi:uncharacterized protein B0T15DRAFT_577636 [Chaetomium strumarium]|uniref:Uncharacterized protein n=1 Tax=Chaetomium strumarium TaxID=1170767 RepID=A0AAJ0GMB7_9PEZI|nr:hypothetical protein B0T15DRAFT_577636 [Chaetomium strumarium]